MTETPSEHSPTFQKRLRGGDLSPGWQAKFGPFRLIPARKQLLFGDRLIGLGGRAFDVLQVLVEDAGVFVDKRRLFDRAWPNLSVDETNLRTAIAAVRRALREDESRPYIETDPGRGYRLVVKVDIEAEEPLCSFLAPGSAVGQEPVIAEPTEDLGRAIELCFGPFCLNHAQRRLYCEEEPVRLGGPSYRVLDLLLSHAGQTVDNLTLIRAVWGSLNIEESSLRAAIAGLRRALAQADRNRTYITTVPRRGYQFSEPVSARYVAQRPACAIRPDSVIGRDAFISAVLDDLQQYRLVSVVGPGGFGKTTVAKCIAKEAVARGCVEQAGFVSLDVCPESESVLEVIARDLAIHTKSDDLWREIEAFLENRNMLIVLDDCDRHIAAAVSVVETIRTLNPNVRLVCTSREPLRAADERIRRLDGLSVPSDVETITAEEALGFAAVELFVERARATASGFELTDGSAPFVASICRRLDGCPLAIEIAAARMDAFELPVLAELATSPLFLQLLGQGGAAPRHRTLASCLDWSFDTLTREEKLAFRRLSVFEGSFSFDVARQVIGFGAIKPIDVSDLVTRLASKSLVLTGSDPSQRRFRLPSSGRVYASTKLGEAGECDELAERRAQYDRAFAAGERRQAHTCRRDGWGERARTSA